MISFSRAAAEGGDLTLPVGFRFRPTDEELVDYYLKNKVQGRDFHAEGIIDEIDILKFEPWDLVAKSLMKPDDESGFFFSQPEYTPKKKTKRTTEVGFWKITGREHDIRTRDRRRTVIGKKRILTFYIGHVRNSDKTNWVMHEYYIPKAHPNANQRDFVLCHLKKTVKNSGEIHTDVATTCDEVEPSTHNESDFENPPARDMIDILEEYVDYNALQPAFVANDSDAEFAEFLKTVLVEPDGGVTSDTDMEPLLGNAQAEMDSAVFYGSSQPSRDTGGIFRYQISPQAASSVNVAPKPETDRVQLKSDASQRPRHQSGPIIDTSADEYYTKEKTRRRTNPPAKPKQPAYRRTAADLPQKHISPTNSSQDKKVAQGKNAEKGMEQTQNITTVSNWKGSFITWQTSPLTTSTPSVYISNIFLGLFLLYFCVREVVLYGPMGSHHSGGGFPLPPMAPMIEPQCQWDCQWDFFSPM
ncbi:NAC domain-containing protein 5 [Prunus yedoensis var. nudiflora]|uniref:NAC domain-containing protein 5 n=1 Tax=Prunus yedoensis var. nudiflora TaxID=2094558 RepID=A0A314YPF6_PRUYE|nr:NAC domain-containing protein 5 [Prunus yedoensis var. nudiflora]